MEIQQPSARSSETISLPRASSADQAETRDPAVRSARPWWRTLGASRVALVLILLVAAYFRTLSLGNWDSGTGQHPDERFFRDVASLVRLPSSPSEYFDSARSPGNPRNYEGKGFFVYGPFPIFLTRLVAVALTPNEMLPETVPAILAPPNPQTNFGTEQPNPERALPKFTWLQSLLNPEGKNLATYGEIAIVGRSLAVLFDLGSILMVYLIARRLFDRRVGLLAALLSALAVMQIQQSHFFVDPIFSTFFALLALYWTVRVAQGGGWGNYVALGITIGVAMANRITLATLGLMAIVAALVAAATLVRERQRQTTGQIQPTLSPTELFQTFVLRCLPLLCLAGLLTLLTFRTFQPDAFVGSLPSSPPVPGAQPSALDALAGFGFFDIRPDPRFLQNMQTIQLLVTGKADAPPSHQWVNRINHLFPWQNMVFWGMGPALGLVAWLGWLYAGLLFGDGRLWRRRFSRAAPLALPALVLWVWIGFFFAWQGGQFAITMRYMLPIYGALIIFAAWLLLRLWDWGNARLAQQALPPTPHPVANPAPATDDAATLPSALHPALDQAHPTDDVATTPLALHPTDDAATTPLALHPTAEQTPANDAAATVPPASQVVATPRFSALGARLTFLRWSFVLVVIATFAWAYAFTRIYEQPHSRVIAARWLAEHAPLGSYITFEEWDDPLPLQVDGPNLWDSVYRGVRTAPYAEDEETKYFGSFDQLGQFQDGLLDDLDRADYITLTSNRVWASATRLPMRFPALTRYYHYLFTGELGFELVADITSYPRIFGIAIPDQIAEEAFSVYDHPRVLIFKKTPAYTRERAEQLITSDVNWGEVYKLPVGIADRAPTALRLTESQWPRYTAGGTWSAFFNPQSWVNTLAPLVWLLVLYLIGLAAFALLFRFLPRLPDRGYSLARTLGLLLVAYAAWLLGSLKLLPFAPTTLWLCAAPLLLLGAWAAWSSRNELYAFWQERRAALLSAEAIFLSFFLFGLVLRWLNPDLWHPARGGEKPMDMAYLNAVLKSAAFPPYDPWHAGGYINYYYFGFVIVGALIHLTTIVPSIAYNLAVPLLFALTALGAWGAVYNLLAPLKIQLAPRNAQPAEPIEQQEAGENQAETGQAEAGQAVPTALPLASSERRAWISAVLAPLFVLLLGNLAQAIWYVTGYAAEQLPKGRPEWAFWDATRIVSGTVNEFPFFTFLFADLHAHMIVMPFALAMLGLTVALVRMERGPLSVAASWREHLATAAWWGGMLFLLGLLAGTLRATNTWDYPTYVGLTVVTLALLAWRRWLRAGRGWAAGAQIVFRFVLSAGAVALIGNLLFLPFISAFATESSGLELLRNGQHASLLSQMIFADRTSLADLLRINGLWLFLTASVGIVLFWRVTRRQDLGLPLGLLAALVLLLALGLFFQLSAPALLIPLLIAAAVLAWQMRFLPPRLLLPLLWGGTAIALCLLVELVVVKGDVGRMNTVFKFGLHAWTLFGLAGAIAVPWMWRSKPSPTPETEGTASLRPVALSLHWLWRGTLVLLLAASLVYPLTATPSRVADRYAPDLPRTLDGLAFMRYVNGNEAGRDFPLSEDAEAIAWLQQNVPGTPVILEAHLPSYRWAGRVATYTGLPTLLGWEWHQIQQRSAANADPVINYRKMVINDIYNSTNIDQALELIEDYGISYIYVGGLEQALYNPIGLAKFATMVQMGRLETAFTSGNTTIYRVVQPGTPTMLTTDLPVVAPSMRTPPPLMLDQPVNELPAVAGYAWNTWASNNSWLATLVWLLALYGLALLGLPLAVAVFGRWRDGGFAWARLISLLLLGYAVWLPTSLGLWRYDTWGLLGGLLLVLALNVWLIARLGGTATNTAGTGISHWGAQFAAGLRLIGTRLREHRRGVLFGEGLFLLGFVGFTLIRALNPDLWQPVWGGEKPMEFGFLNAILRSPVMPPYDPFFSGGYINYYYYGFYLVSLPIKITGIAPALAYNLIIATLFGVTLAGGYAIVAQLTGRARYGVLGAVFLALLGNLAGVIASGWSSGIQPIINALQNGGLANLGQRLDAWFVGPSRVIPNTINEFPFWAFLFADLHPHLIALPFTVLAIALAYQVLMRAWSAPDSDGSAVQFPLLFPLMLAALTLGALAVTNSWDFPTYTLLIGAALIGAAWRSGWQGLWVRLWRAVLLTVVVALGAMALYMPFFDRFYAFVSGVGQVSNFTHVRDYLLLYGVFLAVLLPVLVGALWRLIAPRLQHRAPTATRWVALGGLGLLLIAAVLTVLLTELGLRLGLGLLLLFCALLLLQRRIASPTWFAFLLAALAWSVSFGIETIFIRDHLAGGEWYRMNTVFKFGVQIWTLLALAAAASLPLLLRGLRKLGGAPAQGVGIGSLAALVVLAAVFPLAGTPSRVAYRFPSSPGPTLDGLAFMQQAEFEYDCRSYGGCEPGVDRVTVDLRGDAKAIEWLNQHITGTPIVMQSNLWFYRAYGIRIAANTGLPTVISSLHANEQRDPFITGVRDRDVETLYRTTDVETTLRLLAKYRVNYIYVGGVERAFYNEAGLRKFETMRDNYLDVVYDQPGVQIYAVRILPQMYAAPQPYNFIADAPPVAPPPPAQTIDPPAGLEELERAVAANPADSPLAFGLAEQYRSMNRLDDAARVLQVAAGANPNDVGLHHLWGDILTQAGRYDEAEQAYLRAAQTDPTAGNWNKLGAALLDWGRLDKAELALKQAVASDPNAPDPHYHLGRLYQQQNRRDEAIAELETYLQLAPEGSFSTDARSLLSSLQS